jgi:hypothetical protein
MIKKNKKKKAHPSEANVNGDILSTEHRTAIDIRIHTCHRLLMWIDCCSLKTDLCPIRGGIKESGEAVEEEVDEEEDEGEEEGEENDKKRTRINKSIALVAHTHIHIHIISTSTDSGNEATSNSFIVLLSVNSDFRVNDS